MITKLSGAANGPGRPLAANEILPHLRDTVLLLAVGSTRERRGAGCLYSLLDTQFFSMFINGNTHRGPLTSHLRIGKQVLLVLWILVVMHDDISPLSSQ